MSGTTDGPQLHPSTLELAQGRNFAAMSTLLPSGAIQTQYVWVGTDGERLSVNTEVHRAKYRNVQEDPRITLCIRDEGNPYRYAEVRGRVAGETRGQEARDDIDALSQKYEGRPYPPEQIKSERVILWIVPERQTVAG